MTAFDQNTVQTGQRLDRNLRRPQHEVRAHGGVEHPSGDNDDDAGIHFDVDDLTGGSALAVLAAHAATEERMPAVEDLDFLPDMGRMDLQWRSGAPTGCSPAHCAPDSAPQRS